MRLSLRSSCTCFVALVLLLLASPPVHATTYIVDPSGSGDFTLLSDALVAAVSGDSVALQPATYIESGWIVKDAVTVYGLGDDRTQVVLVATSAGLTFPGDAKVQSLSLQANGTALAGNNAASTITAVDCIFENCTFLINGPAFVDASGCDFLNFSTSFPGPGRFEKCRFNNSAVSSGALILTGNSELISCTFERFLNFAVNAAGTTSLLARKCTFDETDANLRAFQLGDVALVEDCTFNRSSRGGVLRQDGGSQLTIRRCDFTNTDSGDAILVENASGPVLIEDCTFDNIGGLSSVAVVDVVESHFVTIRNCEFGNSGTAALRLFGSDNALVEGCSIHGNFGFTTGGIWLDSVTGVRIHECVIENNGAVNEGGAAELTTVMDIDFRGCRIEGNSTAGRPAISTSNGASDILLAQNILAEGGDLLEDDLISRVTFDCNTFFPYAASDNLALTQRLTFFSQLGLEPVYCATAGSVPENSVAAGLLGCPEIGPPAPSTCAPFGIYVTTIPPGIPIMVDGSSLPGGSYVPAEIGDPLSLDANLSFNFPGSGLRFDFTGWSDGGDAAHGITVSDYDEVFEASYQTLYEFTGIVTSGGTIDLPDGYYGAGTQFTISSEPGDSTSVFLEWIGEGAGSYSGSDPNPTITINGPITQTAVYQENLPVSIESDPPGISFLFGLSEFTTPFLQFWVPNLSRTISPPLEVPLSPGTRFGFNSWDGGQPRVHSVIAVIPDGYSNRMRYDLEHELTYDFGFNGNIVGASQGWYDDGTSLDLIAIPNPGWAFSRWIGTGEGSYTGILNPAPITMDGPIFQIAEFVDPTANEAAYDFTLSASAVNPFAHNATATGELREIHLWMTCTNRGLSALEAQVISDVPVLGFTPAPNVLNAGTPTELLLAVGGCPTGFQANFRLGSFLIIDNGTSMCLVPSTANDVLGAVDCNQITPLLTEGPSVTGFSSTTSPPCETGTNGCIGPVSVRLSNLRAEPGDRQVHVRWQTTSEVEHAGFRIYRSAGIHGPWDLVSGEELFVGASPYDFADSDVLPDRRYFYEVGAVDTRGHEDRYGPVEITTPRWQRIVTALAPVRPNPFTNETLVVFTMAQAGAADVSIFDVTGRLVKTLVAEKRPAGEHAITWDGRDAAGRVVPAGVYFSKFRSGATEQTQKVVRTSIR